MAEQRGLGLDELAATIASRAGATAERSYTRSLLDGGITRVAKKFGEEAVEAVIAAVGQDDAALISESADVLYHLLVVLQVRGIRIDDVMDELRARTQRSGHQEKASRKPAAAS